MLLPVLPVIDTIFTGLGVFPVHLHRKSKRLDIVSDNFWERESLIRTGSLDERVEFRRARNRVKFRRKLSWRYITMVVSLQLDHC